MLRALIRSADTRCGKGAPESGRGNELPNPFASQAGEGFLGKWGKSRSPPCPRGLRGAELPPTLYACTRVRWAPGPAGCRVPVASGVAMCNQPGGWQLPKAGRLAGAAGRGSSQGG